MPNNGSAPINSNLFYANGPAIWNPKYVFPPVSSNGANTLPNIVQAGNNTISNLVCSNVVINTTTLTASGVSGLYSFSVELNKITNFVPNTNILVINTVDKTPLTLIFMSAGDCSSVENRIVTTLNTGVDPGCS